MSPVNGSVAPVCPISRNQAVPGMPAARVVVPPAVDLPSAIAALQQLAQQLQDMTNAPPPNNVFPPNMPDMTSGIGGPTTDDGGGLQKKPEWEELDRTYTDVKVYNPTDSKIWVRLTVIDALFFRERSTQVELEWFR